MKISESADVIDFGVDDDPLISRMSCSVPETTVTSSLPDPRPCCAMYKQKGERLLNTCRAYTTNMSYVLAAECL
jgi:hypothetical protein